MAKYLLIQTSFGHCKFYGLLDTANIQNLPAHFCLNDLFYFYLYLNQCSSMLRVSSPFSDNISSFDNEKLYPDVTLTVGGLNKSLRLHRKELRVASETMETLFQGESIPCIEYEPQSHLVTWICPKTATNETYQRVVGKWLRFCYGEDQQFGKEEWPAALDVLLQLRLKCENRDVIQTLIKDHIIETAMNDIQNGAQILCECVKYDSCSQISSELASMILTVESMKRVPANMIDECLMLLPPSYLDVVEFNRKPYEQGEFRTRLRYVKCHKQTLSDEEKREVMRRCKQGIQCREELEEARKEGILDDETLLEQCAKGFDMWKKRWERWNRWESLIAKHEESELSRHKIMF